MEMDCETLLPDEAVGGIRGKIRSRKDRTSNGFSVRLCVFASLRENYSLFGNGEVVDFGGTLGAVGGHADQFDLVGSTH